MIKNIIIILFLLFSFNFSFSYDNQGFTKYNELDNKFSFECEKQCFIVLGQRQDNNILNISGNISGSGSIGYGFVNGQQIIPVEYSEIIGNMNINSSFMFSKLLNYSQIPNDIIVVFIVDGKIQSNNSIINLGKTSVVDDFNNGFKEALTYKEYNPRTINFLEGPTWNGKYINQTFFPLIIILLIISLFGYFFGNHHIKKGFMYFGVGTIVFFWIFFDFFSITNQVKIYSDIKSASNIMVNGRVGKQSDFYDFLEFIKTQVPYKEKGIFIAPYPFDFEGKYHIYPDVKFEEINKVKYLFWYNPYGEKSPFGFKDPIYESGALLYNSGSYSVEKEIKWKDYAKIYIIK